MLNSIFRINKNIFILAFIISAVFIIACSSNSNGKELSDGDVLVLRYSQMKRYIVGTQLDSEARIIYNIDRPKDIIVIKTVLIDIKHPLLNSPSISHEDSYAIFEVLPDFKIPKFPSTRRIKFYFGPGTVEELLKSNKIKGFIFDKNGDFIEIDIVD